MASFANLPREEGEGGGRPLQRAPQPTKTGRAATKSSDSPLESDSRGALTRAVGHQQACQCRRCGEEFPSRNSLFRHLPTCQPPVKTGIKSTDLRISHQNNGARGSHTRDARPGTCESCCVEFHSRNQLFKHLKAEGHAKSTTKSTAKSTTKSTTTKSTASSTTKARGPPSDDHTPQDPTKMPEPASLAGILRSRASTTGTGGRSWMGTGTPTRAFLTAYCIFAQLATVFSILFFYYSVLR